MICNKCGAELDSSAKYCEKCGSATGIEHNVSSKGTTNESVQKPQKAKWILLICVIASFAYVIFGGRGYKETIKKYNEAALTADAKGMISYISDDFITYSVKLGAIESKRELVKETQAIADESKWTRNITYGEDWTYTIEIVETYNYSEDETDMYVYYNYSEMEKLANKIKDVMEAYTIVSIYDDDKEVETIESYVTLIKIGRKWYIENVE